MIVYLPKTADEGREIVESRGLRPRAQEGHFRFLCCRGSMACDNPVHAASGIVDPMIHSAMVIDPTRDELGRRADPFRTWRWARRRRWPPRRRPPRATLANP